MTAIKYSQALGKSRALLSVYRKNRNMPKKTEPREIYEAYMNEVREQDDVINQFQQIYFELKDAKAIRKFGLVLEEKGVMTHKSLQVAFGRCFRATDRLIGYDHIQRFKRIIELYEEWKCQISST